MYVLKPKELLSDVEGRRLAGERGAQLQGQGRGLVWNRISPSHGAERVRDAQLGSQAKGG